MKLLKGYYAYLAVAGGFLLSFAAKDNWALQMLAYGLISAGALSLQGVSRWYMRASVAADVKMVFSLVLGPAVIPPGLLRIVLYYIGLVPLLLTGCMLLMGVKDQMHKIDRSTLPEWALLAVWSAGYIRARERTRLAERLSVQHRLDTGEQPHLHRRCGTHR